MKLTTFIRKFPSNRACLIHFANQRMKSGVTCPHCSCTEHYLSLGKFPKFECKSCGHQQSIKANTVMHHSKLSYRTWFIAFHLVTSTHNSFSAAEIQRQLGHKYYNPIWQCMHKIRVAMGRIEEQRKLGGDVEIDEAYFSTQFEKCDLPELTYHGKARKNQKRPYAFTKTKVVVMAESMPLEKARKGYKIPRVCGKIKMIVVPDFTIPTITTTVKDRVDRQSTIWSDYSSSHKEFPNIFAKYIPQVINPKDLSNVLPYVHICIGNSKATIRNVHHCIKKNYLQMYLDEYVWKFNRRKRKDIFDLMVSDMTQIKNELLLNKRKLVA